MSSDPYILITADTHAGGSHAQYREYLDPQYRERFDEWRGGYRNPAQEHYGSKKMRNWDLEIRTRDQNSQGVVGEVVFPNTVPPFYRKSIVTAQPPRPENFELCLAGIRAHNRWLKDFCAEDPLRRAGVGLILPNDLNEAIKDIEFIARDAGLVSYVIKPNLPKLGKQYGKLVPKIRQALTEADGGAIASATSNGEVFEIEVEGHHLVVVAVDSPVEYPRRIDLELHGGLVA